MLITSKCLLSGWCSGVRACLNMCVTNLWRRLCSSGFFNVCFHWLDVTATDSRPVHLPEAECQGIMRHLVVKFRIWQNALKPSRLQMQREQPGQSDDFPFPANYIIFPFASSQTNDQIVQQVRPLFGHRFLLFVMLDTSDTPDKSNYRSWPLPVTCCNF